MITPDKLVGRSPPVIWEAPDWIRWPFFMAILWVVFLFVIRLVPARDRFGDRINLDWMWRRTLHFFGVWTGGEGDTNFVAVRAAADHLGRYESENWLKAADLTAEDLRRVVAAVETVEAKVAGPAIRAWLDDGEEARDEVWKDAARLLGVDEEEAALRLRLWDGCLGGAKTIAISTRSGRNWPWWRRKFANGIEARTFDEPDYYAGALAAFAFKMGRNEPVSFLGVPKGNVLRVGRAISEAG